MIVFHDTHVIDLFSLFIIIIIIIMIPMIKQNMSLSPLFDYLAKMNKTWFPSPPPPCSPHSPPFLNLDEKCLKWKGKRKERVNNNNNKENGSKDSKFIC